ncbi:MAG: hypothetical protein HN576_06295, partial [Bacteriovoracaceae bacterium]|nr:hypothetical protein [Bacteriovoracaceae bacterium]
SLYQVDSNSISDLNYIPGSVLDLTEINLRIDTNNQTTNPINQCDLSSCQAKGFDCCLDGQCVNDGTLRSNATSQTNYSQAISDVLLNPLAFINYPNVFYICTNITHPTPTATPSVDPSEAAQLQFEREVREFYCLEEGKKEFPDFAIGKCSDNISINKTVCNNLGEVWTYFCQVGSCSNVDYDTKFDCESNAATWTIEYSNSENANGTQIAHDTIRSDVWLRCGCVADPFPANPEDPLCPDFGLQATTDVNNVITAVSCLFPPSNTEPTPFQNLTLSVPARSAPHRFFATDGTFYDDLSTIQTQTNIVQEGEEFSYLDEFGKTDPVNGAFNINSVLGQMNVQLSRAQPAKMIGLDFDQTYIISAISGFYTPCPSCANDSWFEPFKAFPATQGGNGLQAIGFITNRESYSNNLSLGNYGDTKFGRACWLPPTMIPLSHKKDTNMDTQRRDRLTTQAALWINGYQKDWYGFNQGALIGSFDGVSWFAIGSGRRIVATSNKLYLAINAPFADLAEPSAMIVSVIQDNGLNIVADHDFDPDLPLNDPRQNHAGTCQFFHQCDLDKDCITKLGWEYVCQDVTEFKSKWPKFDIDGSEKVDDEVFSAGFNEILHGFKLGTSPKRCVYRGQGAICRTDWSGETDNKKKQLRCAPNFYCAGVTDNNFNKEVARSPNFLEFIFFGQEADFLGRPKNYVGGSSALPAEVSDNINYNSVVLSTNTGPMGICRAGKKIVSNFIQQHMEKDIAGRTDYINQISSCNSTLEGDTRATSCPVIQEEEINTLVPVGDLVYDTGAVTDYTVSANQQNMCGGESKNSPSPGIFDYTFEEIEEDAIASVLNILFPVVAKDACLRKAGSVCHTDLDCGPNRLHSAQAFFIGQTEFGNTSAENSFWQEDLICGQSAPVPAINAPEFGDYDITQNLCCREIGKDLTMFTEYSQSNDDNVISGTHPDVVESIFNGNEDLRVLKTPATNITANATSADGRYSRYSSVDIQDNFPASSSPYHQAPKIEFNIVTTKPNGPRAYQWKTINDTGRRSCCGAGWVRKFSDGGNDWSNKQRLQFDFTNLECINYRSEMHNERPVGITGFNYDQDVNKICLMAAEDGCVQYPLNLLETPLFGFNETGTAYSLQPDGDFDIREPSLITIQKATMDTSPITNPLGGGDLIRLKSHWTTYMPSLYPNPMPYVPSTPSTVMQNNGNLQSVSFILPIYIQKDNLDLDAPFMPGTEVTIRYFNDQGEFIGSRNPAIAPFGCVINQNPSIDLPENMYCLNRGETCFIGTTPKPAFDETTCLDDNFPAPSSGVGTWTDPGIDVFHVHATTGQIDFQDWAYAGVALNYVPSGSPNYRYCASVLGAPIDSDDAGCVGAGGTFDTASNHALNLDIRPLNPGNDNFYMTKLGRLELLGIPQIAYDPIYCSSNRNELIGGIYDGAITNRAEFETAGFVYGPNSGNGVNLESIYTGRNLFSSQGNNPSDTAVLKDKIQMADIFSENEFMCCRELGLQTDSGSNCCSGSATQVNNVLTCTLPQGADLNVYFNKFVSGEGTSDYINEDLRLNDGDFVPETGEPKFSEAVYTKIQGLGLLFCANNSVRGGATSGNFFAQPNANFFANEDTGLDIELNRYRSLIDSNSDFDADNDTGSFRYLEGYRWGHHIYCN